jgi:hypothetical protein
MNRLQTITISNMSLLWYSHKKMYQNDTSLG